MSRMLVGVNTRATAERLCTYLEPRVGDGDFIVVVNSRQGTDSYEQLQEGKDALSIFPERLPKATVETYQYVRGERPVDDLMRAAEEFDVEEIVIGFRKRRPSGRLVFGSMSQSVLLASDVPVRAVPLE
jgi:nucleotide-binding universal stress UspA family protein